MHTLNGRTVNGKKPKDKIKWCNNCQIHIGIMINFWCRGRQELADQIHLSREVSCRLFKKMTGKTITAYLEEYRVNKSFPLVQSGQYSMVQIAEMTGFSNPSRFADAFRRRVGCNPGDYSRNRKITNDKIQNILNI